MYPADATEDERLLMDEYSLTGTDGLRTVRKHKNRFEKLLERKRLAVGSERNRAKVTFDFEEWPTNEAQSLETELYARRIQIKISSKQRSDHTEDLYCHVTCADLQQSEYFPFRQVVSVNSPSLEKSLNWQITDLMLADNMPNRKLFAKSIEGPFTLSVTIEPLNDFLRSSKPTYLLEKRMQKMAVKVPESPPSTTATEANDDWKREKEILLVEVADLRKEIANIRENIPPPCKCKCADTMPFTCLSSGAPSGDKLNELSTCLADATQDVQVDKPESDAEEDNDFEVLSSCEE
jgi:hypothetical protein